MNRTAHNLNPNAIVAAFQRAGGSWRAAAAKRENGGLRFIDAREFALDEGAEMEAWLDQIQVERAISILPASSVICRTTTLPEADESQLIPALELQAETYMPGTAPEHRRAMAVLHEAEGESARSGLILAWPERAGAPAPPVNRDLTFAPDVAAVAALLNGYRTAQPLLWIDRESGSAALALSHAQGAVLRASREDADTREQWIADIRRLLVETALSVGHTDSYTDGIASDIESWLRGLDSSMCGLYMPGELIEPATSRLRDAPRDPGWWRRYGIAAGALLATADQLAPLTQLRAELPHDVPTRLDTWLKRFATRRAAALWVLAALILAGLGPLVVAGLRLSILQIKVGPLQAFRDAQRAREEQILMYQELSSRTWPMTKLLADIVNCAPVGITIDSIMLDESDNTVDIRGEADTADHALELYRNLAETGIFEVPAPNYDDNDQRTEQLSFSIKNARVRDAYRMVDYGDDFATNPLRVRLYGEGALTQADRERIAARTDDDEMGSEPRTTGRNNPRPSPPATGGNGGSNNGVDPFVDGRVGPRQAIPVRPPGPHRGDREPPEMPELLTPEEIAALPRDEISNRLLKVVNARKNPAFSDEDRAKLQEQFELLMQRMRDTSHFDNQ